jgi:SAM-dependent methyltransferase
MKPDFQPSPSGAFRSAAYWEERYRKGGSSGSGSRGRLANYKARVINELIARLAPDSVIDFGSGDGFQIAMFEMASYTGVDVSPTAVETCRQQFANRENWRFFLSADRSAWAGSYDMALSLDVAFHLIEPEIFDGYFNDVFDHARRWVLIYSSDTAHAAPSEHVLHRPVSEWVRENRPGWRLAERFENPHARDIDAPHDRKKTAAHFMLFEVAVAPETRHEKQAEIR